MPPARPPRVRRSPLAASLLLAAALCACGRAPSSGATPVVAVSVLPQRTFVERIAGERV
ncbi:MAG: hypothetical protein ACR2P8_09415 [Myxococcota bacterium]